MNKEVGLNKKAQGLSTSAIILIVLGVIILVVLIVGFTAGWGVFKEIFGGVPGSESNVDQVAQACQTACLTGSQYDWCTRDRQIKGITGIDEKINYQCNNLVDVTELGGAIAPCLDLKDKCTSPAAGTTNP